ncbi:MAG: SRPBCC family protein, partial [Acidimicrobiales bacterium]|nr:SRPBCC family protein [Acidimicrobiales bacterium]
IKTTPERLWQALTDPAFTSRYWGCTYDTDWRAGSTYVLEQNGARIAHPDQRVLVSDPPRRLSYTWHTFSPEWAEAVGRQVGYSDEQVARLAAEPRSKVTFEIEPAEGAEKLVKLTVIHDGFEVGSAVFDGIFQGWPRLLSALKTLLERDEDPASVEV